MKSSQISTSEVKALLSRAERLSNVMKSDPARPWILVEYTEILNDLSSVIMALMMRQDDFDSVSTRLSSLEMRYSELLYSLKSN